MLPALGSSRRVMSLTRVDLPQPDSPTSPTHSPAPIEAGPVAQVFASPGHPYTRALLASVPRPDRRDDRPRFRLTGEPRSPIDPSPTVCRFFGRCPDGFERCEREMPALRTDAASHAVACHLHG